MHMSKNVTFCLQTLGISPLLSDPLCYFVSTDVLYDSPLRAGAKVSLSQKPVH